MTAFVTPPPLEPGDKVAIVAPSSGLAARYPHVYDLGLERLQSVFDLEPVEFPTATKSHEYLTEHPAERAKDIEDAFADPDISGVVATIGGNSQIRILKHLDGDLLRENPTRFFGTSDNTNLALFLWNHGVVSFQGGTLLTDFATPGTLPAYQKSSLRTALFEASVGEIEPAPQFTDEDLPWDDPDNLDRTPEMESNPGWQWEGGDIPVSGRTWGGSLEITHLHLTADRYLPDMDDLDGSVLLLETSEELPGQGTVRRTFQGMGERGLLSQIDAVLFGRIKARSHRNDRTAEEREQYRESLKSVVIETIREYNPDAPLVFGVDFGHTNPIVPVPVGETVRVDPQEERIVFGSVT